MPDLLSVMSYTCSIGDKSGYFLGGYGIRSTWACNMKLGIILMKKWVFQSLQEGKDMGFHHFVNVPLSCHCASNEYQKKLTYYQ